LAAPTAFTSSLDFEIRCPVLANASNQQRGAIQLNVLRDAIRRLFALLRDEDTSRRDFLDRVATDVQERVLDEANRHTSQRNNAYDHWQELGGPQAAADAERDSIVQRYSLWLGEDLKPWMEAIYPVLDEVVWVGAPEDQSGLIDVLLLADSIGLQAYNWNLELDRSPFRRLDVVVAGDPGLVVLAEVYSEMIPIRAENAMV